MVRPWAIGLGVAVLASVIVFVVPRSAPAAVTPAASSEVGRFTIIHSPHVERDTMLLDTKTGQTWQLVQFTDKVDEPMAWQRLIRLDTPADMALLRSEYPTKAPSATPP